jgi:hypothetical protein
MRYFCEIGNETLVSVQTRFLNHKRRNIMLLGALSAIAYLDNEARCEEMCC